MKCRYLLAWGLACGVAMATAAGVLADAEPSDASKPTDREAAAGKKSAASQSRAEAYTVRYLVFLMRPKQGVTVAPDQVPPIIKELANGSTIPLESMPQIGPGGKSTDAGSERFLSQLRKREPRYQFHRLDSGQATPGPDGHVVVKAGPTQFERITTTLEDGFRLELVGMKDLAMSQRQGKLMVEKDLSTGPVGPQGAGAGFGWGPLTRAVVDVGRTYMGGDSGSDGMWHIYVYSIQRGDDKRVPAP